MYVIEDLIADLHNNRLDIREIKELLSSGIRLPIDILHLIDKDLVRDFYPFLSVYDIVELGMKKISNIQVDYLIGQHDDPILLLDNFGIEYNIHRFLFYDRYKTKEFISSNIHRMDITALIDEKCNEILTDDIIRSILNIVDWKLLTLNYKFSDDFALEVLSYIYIPFARLMQVSEDFYQTHLKHRYEEYMAGYGKTRAEVEINTEVDFSEYGYGESEISKLIKAIKLGDK